MKNKKKMPGGGGEGAGVGWWGGGGVVFFSRNTARLITHPVECYFPAKPGDSFYHYISSLEYLGADEVGGKVT